VYFEDRMVRPVVLITLAQLVQIFVTYN